MLTLMGRVIFYVCKKSKLQGFFLGMPHFVVCLGAKFIYSNHSKGRGGFPMLRFIGWGTYFITMLNSFFPNLDGWLLGLANIYASNDVKDIPIFRS